MKLGTSRRGTMVPALVAFMVLAGVSVSLAARPEPTAIPEPNSSVTVAPPGRPGHHGDEPPGGSDEPAPSAEPPADGTSACAAALDAGDAALETQHGLERAIDVVLADCEKNSAARGLLNALEHLRANQERQNSNGHGGQPNEHVSEHASGNAGTSTGHAEDDEAAQEPGGNGQGGDHANDHANDHATGSADR